MAVATKSESKIIPQNISSALDSEIHAGTAKERSGGPRNAQETLERPGAAQGRPGVPSLEIKEPPQSAFSWKADEIKSRNMDQRKTLQNYV